MQGVVTSEAPSPFKGGVESAVWSWKCQDCGKLDNYFKNLTKISEKLFFSKREIESRKVSAKQARTN